jgi:DNA-binding response OmpR family regulator
VSKRILIVEDDDDLRGLFRDVLVLASFDVEVAADGPQALRRIDNRLPDLVVLNLRLPMVSGVEIRHDLAANTQTRLIPIVVVTGSPDDLGDVEVACLLTKPVSPDRLVETVRNCLDTARA